MKEVFEELVKSLPTWLKVLMAVLLFSAVTASFALIIGSIVALLTI